ncbi:MAG TPA: hypothetical protein VIZ65_00615 [Cellvibrionaceae bacterium]
MNRQYVVISFLIGFLSLSQEIVWVRIISFLGNSVPSAFSYVLFCYIIGIAIGSLVGSKIANSKIPSSIVLTGLMAISSLCALITPIIIQWIYPHLTMPLVCTGLIFISAASNGAIFPLVHHWFTRRGKDMGRSLSKVYFANVMGSALGPVITGFILLDNIPMYLLLQLLATLELCFACVILLIDKQWKLAPIPSFLALATIPWLDTHQAVISHIIKNNTLIESTIGTIVENRHGVIHTLIDTQNQYETVYGGNVYDGGFSVDLAKNHNGIDRAFLLPALRPHPKSVLFIGLSSGSWLRVIASIPTVENITVAEINIGYKQLIENHADSKDLLDDSRITIFYQDGRQLVESLIHQGKKFDLIVMNNTWHWRAYSTNLMSTEFMHKLKSIMHQESLLAFNSTYSPDAVYTAGNTFTQVSTFKNFVYTSESPLVIDPLAACSLIADKINHQSCSQESHLKAITLLEKIQFIPWQETVSEWEKNRPGSRAEIITDSNMITEFKYGKKLALVPL